jgi:transposase
MERAEILAIYEHGPEAVVALVEALIARYEAELTTLQSRVQALEDRLAKDSHNSHQPPSQDRPTPKPKSLRERSGRKPGGQPGHPGTTLAWSVTPEQVVRHRPTICARCGAALTASAVGAPRRQVVELPVLRLETTEHVAEQRRCAVCGHVTSGTFPPETRGRISYGPRLRALAVYLSQYQLLPSARTAELLGELFARSFSAGTLARVVAECHATLAATEGAIQHGVQQAAVAHFDETGRRVAGRQHWVHVASTDRLTAYGIQSRRGVAAMQVNGVLPGFPGVAVHDGYTAYGTFGCQHALCNVQHLRELTFLAEQHQQAWADDLKALLMTMQATAERARAAGQRHLDPAVVADAETRYWALVLAGFAANPPPPKPRDRPGPDRKTAGGKLAERLGCQADAVLRFLYDLRVPFDNNQAERDLRMVKVQQKISGPFRTTTGAAQFGRIRGYLSTARKQGYAPLAALQAACAGTPLVLA